MKEFKYFTIFNHEQEEEYLRKQHQNGWKLTKITGLGTYHFEACEKEDVIYRLDFNQDTQNFDEYITLFNDCGWEYILKFADYTYFRKAKKDLKDNEDIFSDEASKIAMMERVLKGRMLPVFVIFMSCLLPQFIMNLVNKNYFLSFLFGSIVISYTVLFVYCAIHYFKYKNK